MRRILTRGVRERPLGRSRVSVGGRDCSGRQLISLSLSLVSACVCLCVWTLEFGGRKTGGAGAGAGAGALLLRLVSYYLSV